MNAARLHRRLAVSMCLAGLLAFAGGAGFEPLSTTFAAVGLVTALFWQPTPALSGRLERLWLPLALLLVARATLHILTTGGDLVGPVVDLLLLLMCAEALRSLDAPNDGRLYALSFALILASTAYRPGVLFGVAFVAYAVLGTLALTVGNLRRRAASFGFADAPVSRSLLAVTGALSGVVLLSSVLVFLSFPRVTQAWAGRGDRPATSMAGFADEVSLAEHGSRILSNPRVVLRVEFPDGRPDDLDGLHWRGRSYDHFDGVRWSRSEAMRPSAGAARWYEAWGDSVIRQEIFAEPLDVRVLFALHPVLDLKSHTTIHPVFDATGDFIYWGGGTPSYSVVSAATPPSAEALRAAEVGFMPDRTRYLQLPELPDRISALADSLTVGLTTRYDRAKAVESWLRTRFEYTLDLPDRADQTGLDYFLFERRAGHCEYFSTAMVVLLRSVGIQARNVNGFLGGRWSDLGGYLAVSQNEAHSWVEVWFPGFGWVTFDPTPGGGRSAAGAASWLWPGRLLLDALQHRWSTWILDYDLRSQSGLLHRIAAASEETRRSFEGSGGSGWIGAWLLAVGLFGAAGLIILLRRRDGLPPESRLYVTFVQVCRRAGLPPHGAPTPLQLVEGLREARHPAAAPAGRLVDRYLHVRFAGEPSRDDALGRMAEDLRSVRRSLRKQPLRSG